MKEHTVTPARRESARSESPTLRSGPQRNWPAAHQTAPHASRPRRPDQPAAPDAADEPGAPAAQARPGGRSARYPLPGRGRGRPGPRRQRRRGSACGGCPRRPRHHVLLRPGPQGLCRHRAQHRLQGLVHGGRGVLSDVYEPTIDNTNVDTLQYIVTDGATFTDLQTRDMTYTVAADPSGMACTVTASDASHGYRLVTTYITDPARDTVLMHTRLQDLPGSHTALSKLHLYARLDAHVNGDGGGGRTRQNAGANTGDHRPLARAPRSPWCTAPIRSPRRSTATTRCRPIWRFGRPARPPRPASAMRAPPATGSPSSPARTR